VANTLFGLPDLGLLTLTEVVAATKNIADAVTLPVLADADTGYGNHLNVTRTVYEFERAGAAGIFLEDQLAPKRCGHFDGKELIPTREMLAKIIAATNERRDPDFLVVARTDAIAVEGFESAISRARAYAHAGADMVFVEAPRTVEELRTIPASVDVPCVVNLVEGGLTPILPLSELSDFGFKVVLYANLAMRVAAASVEQAFAVLGEDRISTRLEPAMLEWSRRQELVGLPEWQRLDEALDHAADQDCEAASGHRLPTIEETLNG
jgi:2-methylisocitrate lyase-like PEP mutase family enzyme